jgi:hypothetical protein
MKPPASRRTPLHLFVSYFYLILFSYFHLLGKCPASQQLAFIAQSWPIVARNVRRGDGVDSDTINIRALRRSDIFRHAGGG